VTGLNEADEAEADEAEAAALDYTFLPSPKGSGSSAGSAAGRSASVADPPAEPASKDAPPAAPADAAAPSAVRPRPRNPIALSVCPFFFHTRASSYIKERCKASAGQRVAPDATL